MREGRDTASYARQMVVDLLHALGGESTPTLEWTSGPDRGRRYELSAGSTTTIGRSDDCEVCLRDADASRKHAEIRCTLKGVSIADLGSKNGVRVNDERIEGPTTLRDGDRIRIGETELRYGDPAEGVLADLQQAGDEVSAQRPKRARCHAEWVARQAAEPVRGAAVTGLQGRISVSVIGTGDGRRYLGGAPVPGGERGRARHHLEPAERMLRCWSSGGSSWSELPC